MAEDTIASAFEDGAYEVPNTSTYMKLVQGDNNFRIMSKIITGYEYWNSDNKPVRQKSAFTTIPDDAKENDKGEVDIKHFWAMVVWDYSTDSLVTLELTQKGVIKSIMGLIENPKWGSPTKYDLTISKSGAGLTTKYATVSSPPSPAPEEAVAAFKESTIDLEKSFFGKD